MGLISPAKSLIICSSPAVTEHRCRLHQARAQSVEHRPCGPAVQAARESQGSFSRLHLTAFSFPDAGTPEQRPHRRERRQADPGPGHEVAGAFLEGLAAHRRPVHAPLRTGGWWHAEAEAPGGRRAGPAASSSSPGLATAVVPSAGGTQRGAGKPPGLWGDASDTRWLLRPVLPPTPGARQGAYSLDTTPAPR